MADLSINLAGIKSPNPFWLASAPPTNTGYQVQRAFEAGWGGAVWKTLGDPIINTSSRFAAVHFNGQRVAGFNNIELITDRPLEVNLKEIYETKKKFPNRAIIASLMVEPSQHKWHEIVKRVEDVGVDGTVDHFFDNPEAMMHYGCAYLNTGGTHQHELNNILPCGNAANAGNRNTYTQITSTFCHHTQRNRFYCGSTPVIVKLTPNITDITVVARHAVKGGADAISMINTINSLAGVDIHSWNTIPNVGGQGAHGGYCGPAVKPIHLR